MDKQQKNIEQIVAGKTLKDIHKIVNKEKIKEKQEKRWAMIVLALFLVVMFVLTVLKTI